MALAAIFQDSIQGSFVFGEDQAKPAFPMPEGIRKTDIANDTLAVQQTVDSTLLVPRNHPENDWPTILLLFCLALFAWVKFFQTRRLNQIFHAFVAVHFSNQMIREGNLFHERLSLPLQFIALSSISYFLYQSFNYFDLLQEIIRPAFTGYLIVFALLCVLWIIKLIAVRINGLLFRTSQSAAAYNQNMLVYLIITGLLFLPLNILQTYMPSQMLIMGGIILLGIMMLLWIIRAISIGLAETGFSVLHLFLYLCSFEFLPVLVLTKLILETS